MSNVQTGNAADDTTETRGWLIGHFIDEKLGLRHSDDVEIKWGVHEAGFGRAEWVTGETRTAISLLVSGKVEVYFRDQTVVLETPGDYVMWGKGDDHKWSIIEDATIVTVRWPSVPVS